MRRGFTIGVVVLLAVFAVLGWALAASGREDPRPEGVAEDWLAAMSDLTREGLEDDATERLEELGGAEAARKALPAKLVEGKSAFTDLEVGRAGHFGGRAIVPFRVHEREGDNRKGALLIVRSGGVWKVKGLTYNPNDFVLPSEGGPQPSNAGLGWWAGALLVSVVATVLFSALVEWAGRGASVPSTGT
jgi:hypothetical protein